MLTPSFFRVLFFSLFFNFLISQRFFLEWRFPRSACPKARRLFLNLIHKKEKIISKSLNFCKSKPKMLRITFSEFISITILIKLLFNSYYFLLFSLRFASPLYETLKFLYSCLTLRTRKITAGKDLRSRLISHFPVIRKQTVSSNVKLLIYPNVSFPIFEFGKNQGWICRSRVRRKRSKKPVIGWKNEKKNPRE